MHARETRNSLKLGFTSPSLKKNTNLSLLIIPDEKQKKTVNPTLKGYGISCRMEK
jgi:hypothetical protein